MFCAFHAGFSVFTVGWDEIYTIYSIYTATVTVDGLRIIEVFNVKN